MVKVGMMQSSMRVVITGSIASGKSTVSNFIRQKGFRVVDSDSFSKEILKSSLVNGKLLDEFGFSSSSEEFRHEIFFNKELRSFLDDNVYTILYDSYKNMEGDVIFYEIPLYFESIDIAKRMGFVPDLVLYVYAKDELRHLRMMKFRNMSVDDILAREKFFLDDEFKMRNSDFVIFNNGDIENLFLETERFLDENVKKIN